MECPKCGHKISQKDKNICPNCGSKISKETVKSPEEPSLEKTIAIKELSDTKKFDKSTFMDEINKQIEAVNKEASKEKIEEQEKIKKENILSSEESLKSRKKILCLVGSITFAIILIAILFLSLYLNAKSDNKNFSYDYKENLTKSLNDYKDNNDSTGITDILDHLSEDEENIPKVEEYAYNLIKDWLDTDLETEDETLELFKEKIDNYQNLIDNIYNITSTNDETLHIISSSNLNDLTIYLEDTYNNSKIYYEAKDYYNSKDYNKSYYSFSLINETNTWYEKSQGYLNTIENNIISLIKKDIAKIEQNLEDLTIEELLQKYSSIESIIEEYPNIYYNIPLTDNTTYNSLLSTYKLKVEEYTQKLTEQNDEENTSKENNEEETIN